MKYGEVLKILLKEKQVSNAELARRIDKSRSYVSQLINGKIDEPSFGLAIDIADALDTNIEYFVINLEDEDGDSDA